jgi:hypothetical protein
MKMRQAIRDAIYAGQGLYPDPKRLLATKWLREKEIAEEGRAADTYWYVKWTWDAAHAAAVLAIGASASSPRRSARKF